MVTRPLILGAVVVLVAVLSAFIAPMGLVSAVLVVLGVVMAVVYGIAAGIRVLLRKRVSARFLTVPGTAVLAGLAGLVVGYLTGPAPVPPEHWSPSDQLRYMHQTDQADRVNLRFLDTSRDDSRLARAKELLEAVPVTEPEDRLNAAMLFQHGSDSSDYRIAFELASAACSTGVDTRLWPAELADWLRRAAYDRWMLSIGQPQKYGTQGPTIEF